MLSLRDQLTCVELGDNGLEDLVYDRGEHTLVIVLTEFPIDGWEGLNGWSGEHTTADVDHLQVWRKGVSH